MVYAHEPTETTGMTALMFACEFGFTAIVERLIQENANVNIPSWGYREETALILAAGNGHTEAVKLLLAHDAEVDGSYSDVERTALTEAAEAGHKEIVELLLENNADIELSNRDNLTPLELANGRGHLEIEKLLTDAQYEPLVSQWSDVEGNPDIAKAKSLKASVISFSLNAGDDVNAQGKNGATTLMWAANFGRLESIRVLVEARADTKIKDDAGCTALFWAAYRGQHDAVTLLLKCGENPSVTDIDECSVLWYAQNPAPDVSEAAKVRTVEVLLEGLNKAVVSLWTDAAGEVDYEKRKNLSLDTVKATLNAGGSMEAADKHGATLLMQSACSGHTDILDFLLDAKVDLNAFDESGNTALISASKWGKRESVSLLLKANADVHARDNKAWTAFMWAAWHDFEDVTALLKDAGADVNTSTTHSDTALMWAAWNGNLPALRLLLKAGADVGYQDETGKTALMLAARWGQTDAVEILLKSSADKTTADEHGHMALWHAQNPAKDVSDVAMACTVAALSPIRRLSPS